MCCDEKLKHSFSVTFSQFQSNQHYADSSLRIFNTFPLLFKHISQMSQDLQWKRFRKTSPTPFLKIFLRAEHIQPNVFHRASAPVFSFLFYSWLKYVANAESC